MKKTEKKQELEKWLLGEGEPQKYSPLDSLAELLKAIADMLDGEACAEVILDRVADLIEAVNHNSPEDKQAESNVKKAALDLIRKLMLNGF
jgi:hypothetical protein